MPTPGLYCHQKWNPRLTNWGWQCISLDATICVIFTGRRSVLLGNGCYIFNCRKLSIMFIAWVDAFPRYLGCSMKRLFCALLHFVCVLYTIWSMISVCDLSNWSMQALPVLCPGYFSMILVTFICSFVLQPNWTFWTKVSEAIYSIFNT